MGSHPDQGPVRLPPTQPPRRRRSVPRWAKVAAAVAAVVLGAVAVSSVLNHEVNKRLASVPPSSSLPTTTTLPAPTTTAAPARVLGTQLQRRDVPTTSSTTTTTVPAPVPTSEPTTASELIVALDKLPVADEHPKGYRRTQFGFYRDADGDRCETRTEVVIAEALELKMNKRNCTIQSGKWFSPFDGVTSTRLDELAVLHLVSLQETWESGAWQWTDEARNAYLNDLQNPEAMLAVTAESARQRDDEDPGGWQPSFADYRCDYVKAWVRIKTLYKLSVDPGERESIAAAALHC